MANNKNFIAKNGVSTGDGYAMPDVRPSLLLDFANSKTLDPRITFTRGSTATYWDGYTTTKAEENLHTYSQSTTNKSEFDLTSTNNNATAPDGTTTATLLTVDSSGTGGPRYFSSDGPAKEWTSGETYTVSAYFKGGTATYCYIACRTTSANIASSEFNLSTGSASTASATGTWSNASSTMTDVGNGWYRCTLTATAGATTTAGYLFFGVSDGTGIGSGGYPNITLSGQTVYIWGLQKEIRSSATAYTATTSSPIVKYQPTLQTAASGEARFDHDPVTGESKGLLIEEARTNSLTYSEEFDDSSFTQQSVTVEANQAVAPDGTLTADKLVVDSGATTHQIVKLGVILSQTCAVSIFAKAAGVNTFTLLDGAAATNGASFNLSTGVATDVNSGTGTMVDVGNGWYRCTAVMTTTGFRLYCPNATGTAVGDGFNGIFIWGVQLEAGSFPTSYIPTSGSTVTRSLEYAEIAGTSFDFFNNQEATLYAELDMTYSGDNSKGILGVNTDTTGVSGRLIAMYLSSGLQFYFDNYSFGSVTASGNGGPTPPSKVALSFSATSYLSATDGSTAANRSGSYSIGQATRLQLGNAYNISGYPLNGHLKKVACYPKQLTSATLQAMTEE